MLHRQLAYLLTAMERPNMIIRVVPSAGVDVPPVEGFELLRFPVAPAVVHTGTKVSDLFIEEPEDIDVYDDVVHGLMRTAMNTGESAGFITRLMHALEEDPDVLPNLGWAPVAEE